MGGVPRKDWSTPELVVLARTRPEESVLAACKLPSGGAGPMVDFSSCGSTAAIRAAAGTDPDRGMSGFVRYVKQSAMPVRSRLGAHRHRAHRALRQRLHPLLHQPAGGRQAATRPRDDRPAGSRSVLRQAADLGCLQVRFTGGEPLLRPDFEELYLFARRLGLAVLVFTNARRVTPRLADLLARIPPRGAHRGHGLRHAPPSPTRPSRRVPGSLRRSSGAASTCCSSAGSRSSSRAPCCRRTRDEVDEFDAWAATIPWMIRGRLALDALRPAQPPRRARAKNRLIASLRASPDDVRRRRLPATRRTYRVDDVPRSAPAFMGRPAPSSSAAAPATASPSTPTGAPAVHGRARARAHRRRPRHPASWTPSALESLRRALAGAARHEPRVPAPLRRLLPARASASSARPSRGPSTAPWTRRWKYLCEVAHAQARYLGWLEHDAKGWNVADWENRVRKSTMTAARSLTARAVAGRGVRRSDECA